MKMEIYQMDSVAPLAGAWIEISRRGGNVNAESSSLPLRERGLKLSYNKDCYDLYAVAPLAGAWIEIALRLPELPETLVAPLAGAWIEIYPLPGQAQDSGSLPLRERGLKYTSAPGLYFSGVRRSPCGSVD